MLAAASFRNANAEQKATRRRWCGSRAKNEKNRERNEYIPPYHLFIIYACYHFMVHNFEWHLNFILIWNGVVYNSKFCSKMPVRCMHGSGQSRSHTYFNVNILIGFVRGTWSCHLEVPPALALSLPSHFNRHCHFARRLIKTKINLNWQYMFVLYLYTHDACAWCTSRGADDAVHWVNWMNLNFSGKTIVSCHATHTPDLCFFFLFMKFDSVDWQRLVDENSCYECLSVEFFISTHLT